MVTIPQRIAALNTELANAGAGETFWKALLTTEIAALNHAVSVGVVELSLLSGGEHLGGVCQATPQALAAELAALHARVADAVANPADPLGGLYHLVTP